MSGYAKIAAAAAALAVLPACAASKPKPAELKNQTLERAVTIKVTGARTFQYSGRPKVVVVSRPGSGENLLTSVAALNPVDPIMHGKEFVRADIGFTGAYTGDGTFELPAGAGQPVPTAGPTLAPPTGGSKGSTVAIAFTAGTQSVRFAYALEPCSLTFRNDATEGSATCPKLAAPDGSTVSFEMTWGP